MASSYTDIFAQLQQKKYSPVYFLHGDETYYIDKVAEYIEKNLLTESEKGFNQTVFYGRDVEVATLLNAAKRFPMMAERQVVIVKEAQEITNLLKEDGQKLMESYLNNPVPSTVLVLCYKYKKLDQRTKFAQLLGKNAVVMESKKLYDDKIPGWIIQYVKSTGSSIDDKAATLIAEYIGNNLDRLSHEIDKILINFSEPIKITTTHVQKYIGISKDYNTFELQKAIALRNFPMAMRIANYFEANPKGNPLILVVNNIFTFYSKLLLIHGENDKSEGNIAGVIGVNRFFVGEYMIAVRNYSLAKTIENIGHTRIADMQSKGYQAASMTDGHILKELIFKLMN